MERRYASGGIVVGNVVPLGGTLSGYPVRNGIPTPVFIDEAGYAHTHISAHDRRPDVESVIAEIQELRREVETLRTEVRRLLARENQPCGWSQK